jgi:hypothetical protein
MPSVLPEEFEPSALVDRIILGAVDADQVRLHGAIVAALEIHGDDAGLEVFTPALAAAREHSSGVRDSVAAAIHSHVG